MATLNNSGIVFSNGEVLYRDPMKVITQYTNAAGFGTIGAQNAAYSNASWINGTPNQTRGVLYNTRYSYDTYSGAVVYLGVTQITINNLTDSATMRINIVGGVASSSDDTYRYYVVRGGSIVNSSTHSGGTVLIDSTTSGSGVFRSTSITQDIGPNSSATFTHYSGVLNGSSFDYLTPYLSISFNAWV